MSISFNKFDFKDIVMVGGIICSICGAAISYGKSNVQLNNTMEEIRDIKTDMENTHKLNQDQNIILERITANMNYFTEQIKDIKQMVIDEKKENNSRYLKNKDVEKKSRWEL